MYFLFTCLLSFAVSASHTQQINLDTLVIPLRKSVPLALPHLTDAFKNADSIFIDGSIKAHASLLFNGSVRCGTAMSFMPSELPAYLVAMTVQFRGTQATQETLEVTISLYDHGKKLGVYSIPVQPMITIPVEAVTKKTRLRSATPTALLRLSDSLPEAYAPRVVLKGSAATKVATTFKNRVVYATLKPGATITTDDTLQLNLVDDKTGLRSPNVSINPSASHWKRIASILSAAGLAFFFATAGVLVVRRQKPAKNTQQSIDEWNNSFACRSVTSIKTDEESFSTVISQFEDAQLSRRAHSGILLSPSVEVLDLPFDLRVNL